MDSLNRLLDDLHARADADPYFADVPLFKVRPRLEPDGTAKDNASFATIQQRIDEALACSVRKAGKGGAAVQFLMPIGDNERPNVEGPQLRFVYTIRVQEDPVANFGPNGTQKTAEEIALKVLQLFHLVMFNGGNCLAADAATFTPSSQSPGRITYDVRLVSQGTLARPLRVARPVLSVTSGAAPQSVTLTCGTAGARIFYTTDGSYPSSVNLNATRYTAAFTVATAATLRVAAEAVGYQQSDVAQGYFT